MNTRATRLVNDLSRTSGELAELGVTLVGLKDRYTANGGQEFIHEHFVDADGAVRTDLEISEARIITAVSALGTIIQLLDQYKDVLIQAAP